MSVAGRAGTSGVPLSKNIQAGSRTRMSKLLEFWEFHEMRAAVIIFALLIAALVLKVVQVAGRVEQLAGSPAVVTDDQQLGPAVARLNEQFRQQWQAENVQVGDTVTARVEVTGLVPEKSFVIFKTQCLVRDTVVIDGEATLKVPARAK